MSVPSSMESLTVHSDTMDWIPTAAGNSFRPLRFEAEGWSELMRLEPGIMVPLHRHTGEVHAFNLSGTREILGTGEIIGPGDYAYEPPGTVDAWRAVGDSPCVVHIKLVGTVEYVDDHGDVTGVSDTASQYAAYLKWCDRSGVDPLLLHHSS